MEVAERANSVALERQARREAEHEREKEQRRRKQVTHAQKLW